MVTKKYIPQKVYYSIKEVADMLGLSTPLLRMWEREFPDIKPRRTSTGIRMYTQDDINTIRKIQNLVKGQGLTINGAKQVLRNNPEMIDRKHDVIMRLTEIKEKLLSIIDEMKQE